VVDIFRTITGSGQPRRLLPGRGDGVGAAAIAEADRSYSSDGRDHCAYFSRLYLGVQYLSDVPGALGEVVALLQDKRAGGVTADCTASRRIQTWSMMMRRGVDL
jgi:hypothetical protein